MKAKFVRLKLSSWFPYCIIRLDELSFEVRRSRQITKDSSSRRIMRPVVQKRALSITLLTADAPKIWIKPARIQRACGKNLTVMSNFIPRDISRARETSLGTRLCSDVNVSKQERHWNQRNFSHWRWHWMLTKRDLQFLKPYEIVKVKNMKHFVSPRFTFGAKNGSPSSGIATRS